MGTAMSVLSRQNLQIHTYSLYPLCYVHYLIWTEFALALGWTVSDIILEGIDIQLKRHKWPTLDTKP
jgi:hypothetical protein